MQLNNTRLEALITLPGVGTDWVHAKALDRLYITLADRGELAVVDLSTNKLVHVNSARHRQAAPAGAQPGRKHGLGRRWTTPTACMAVDTATARRAP